VTRNDPRITRTKPRLCPIPRRTGTNYTIYNRCPTPGPARGHWRPVLVMDGDYMFDAAAKAARSLGHEGRIPPTASSVSGTARFGKPGNFRGRDYTPDRLAG